MASKDHGLTPIELSSFCSEIALMLGAGMPLYAGMEALEKTYEDDAHAALYRGVSETLTQTGSLRDALESARFPDLSGGDVRRGRANGPSGRCDAGGFPSITSGKAGFVRPSAAR